MAGCLFCAISPSSIVCEAESCVAFSDFYPISRGHTLVIPRCHVESIFELPPQDLVSLWSMVTEVRAKLFLNHNPLGFNIGVNDGKAAGQTVPHVHVHIIPRYNGDVKDPRGGVRWVIPEKARYWESTE